MTLSGLVCMLGPVVDEAPPSSSNAGLDATQGPSAAGCVEVITAAHLPPTALPRRDPSAIADLRHAILERDGSADRDGLLGFFDAGAAAVVEGRKAHQALLSPPLPTSESLDQLRRHPKLDALSKLPLPEPLSTEARALALVIATSHFIHQARWQPAGQAYAAEPLFVLMFGDALSAGDHALGSWEGYLALAVRNLDTRSAPQPAAEQGEMAAVGGGPRDMSGAAGCARVIAAVRGELDGHARRLTDSALSGAVNRTLHHLAAMDRTCGFAGLGESDTSE
jgi:hypothetical protein